MTTGIENSLIINKKYIVFDIAFETKQKSIYLLNKVGTKDLSWLLDFSCSVGHSDG